ncbi:MAG TPA: hypothetical protein VFC07_13045 [Verrucomicrobiae bacterium]|nr:hypothetical protein [Verrucomicrobiae bacterium]
MTFWQPAAAKTTADRFSVAESSRLRLAAEVLAASDPVPDPEAHLNYLEQLTEPQLIDRLKTLEQQRTRPRLPRYAHTSNP